MSGGLRCELQGGSRSRGGRRRGRGRGRGRRDGNWQKSNKSPGQMITQEEGDV